MSRFEKKLEAVRYLKRTGMSATTLRTKTPEELKIMLAVSTSVSDADMDDEFIDKIIKAFELM